MRIRQYCLSLWMVFDPIYYFFTRLEHLKNAYGNKTVLRVRLTRYKGREMTLSDGTVIRRNDLLVKIHLHNVKLLRQIQRYDNELRRAKFIYKSVRDALPSIVQFINSQHARDEIRGVIGITMLHKGCGKLGFETRPISSSVYRHFKRSALLPIYYLSSSNKGWHKKPDPMYLLMSKESLKERYGKI
ncbi:MAG TPA: hypothetical protein VIG80_08390 [Bacillaceae bacterium]